MLTGLVGQEWGTEVYHVQSVEQAKGLPSPAAIVNAVPDFPPVTEQEKTTRNIMEHFLDRADKGTMLEMCYHPNIITGVFKLGQAKGWTVVPGTEAMVWQGVEQARLWTGLPISEIPVRQAREAVQKALATRSH